MYYVFCFRINAVNDSRASRDTSEVKKKWQDISNLTKKKEAERIKHRRVTGGGPAMNEDIKPWEQLVEICTAFIHSTQSVLKLLY